jgi:N utilization substance protein B
MASEPDRIRSRRAGRRLALVSLFEAEFGQRTPEAILERHLAEREADPEAGSLAREILQTAVVERERIDALIERHAPRYPVVQLARIDRSLLRGAISEVLHSATTPARVAIAEWVELARIYSGESTRRLMNGVLGHIAAEAGRVPPSSGRAHASTAVERPQPR